MEGLYYSEKKLSINQNRNLVSVGIEDYVRIFRSICKVGVINHQVETIYSGLRDVVAEHLAFSTWMDAATQQLAADKVRNATLIEQTM